MLHHTCMELRSSPVRRQACVLANWGGYVCLPIGGAISTQLFTGPRYATHVLARAVDGATLRWCEAALSSIAEIHETIL